VQTALETLQTDKCLRPSRVKKQTLVNIDCIHFFARTRHSNTYLERLKVSLLESGSVSFITRVCDEWIVLTELSNRRRFGNKYLGNFEAKTKVKSSLNEQ